MSEDFAKIVLLFAGELFLLSGIVVALAWEAAHTLRRTASLRHLVWAGAFVSLLVLPVLALTIPPQIHFALPSLLETHVLAPSPPAVTLSGVTDSAPVEAAAAEPPAFHFGLAMAAMAMIALWLAGVSAIALRGLAAAYGLRVLKRQSKTYIFNSVTLPEGRYEIRIARKPNGYGPVTWGIFRPVILLPFAAHFWPRERLEAVLMHEAAHVRRRDSLSQLLSMLVCALYWPIPLVWIAAGMLRAEAEMAADDTVLASGFRPSSYAGELLQLASEFRSREPALAGMPLFMAGSALEARVKSVLAPTQLRSGVTKMDVVKICSVALLATSALVLARPTLAQDEPQAPPAVASAPLPPAATPAPPAAPVPPAVAASSSGPDVRVREEDRVVRGHRIRRVWVTVNDPEHIAEEAMRNAHPRIDRAMQEMQRVRPEIDKAQIELRVHAAQLRALEAEQPKIEARVEAALERVRPEIEKAMKDARLQDLDLRVREKIDRSLGNAVLRVEVRRNGKRDAGRQAGPSAEPDQN